MKIAAYFCMGGLFMSTLACNYTDHEALLPVPQSGAINPTVTSREVYPFIMQLLVKSQKAYIPTSTTTVRENALDAWKDFIYHLLQSPEQWKNADYYLQWYEDNLAYSCAFTSVQQEGSTFSIHWDYNQLTCYRPKAPQSGSCTLTMYQQSGTFYAQFEYNQIAFGTKVISGFHTLQGRVEVDGSPHVISETLNLQ
ncbi:hypothetical protein [Tunicatimonas pelagia]|uniref:hypothetical protein n=1 Tax=Tunicatimonas pelagia TaxID=931531 RepID=UPI0026660071|nr:hypothetical protein [Tunicatimonas pelagia]WKN44417.1 hypothetical protein P0M28_05495 [Tunicatimonas pelagia]